MCLQCSLVSAISWSLRTTTLVNNETFTKVFVLLSYVACVVGTVAVGDDDLEVLKGLPAELFEQSRKFFFFVECDDDDAERGEVLHKLVRDKSIKYIAFL